MKLPTLTTEAIVEALSDDWQPINALIFKLNVKDIMDARFLQIKLKELERKNLILVETKLGKNHFRLNESDDIVDDLEEDYDVDTINWGEQDNLRSQDYPRSQDNIEFIFSEVEYLLEKISDMDILDENTMMDIEMNIFNLSKLGDTYFKHGDYRLAKDFYKSALKLDTASGEDMNFRKFLLKDIGNLFFEEGNHQEAIKYYENALEFSILEEVSPFNREILFNLGTSYSNIKQPKKAILYFEKLAKHDPELDIIWSALGLAYSAEKEYGKAVECFEIALQFNPLDEDIKDNLNLVVDQIKKKEQPILEELGKSIQEIQNESILSLLKELNDKFGKMIKIAENSNAIHIKSYVNDLIKPFFEKPSNKKIKKLKKSIGQHIEDWPEDEREEFFKEFFRTIKRYEDLQPPKWKKYGLELLKIIPVLR